MLRLTQVLGTASEPHLAARLHDLAHRGAVEYVTLRREDTSRRRLHVFTDRGTEGAIILDRSERLANGAVLLLDEHRAVVVRLEEAPWLALETRDSAAALELGYFCGNMHWKVRFVGEYLHISLQGPRADYLERLAHLLADGRISVVGNE
ncbi:MAG: urease accessory protein UreE [Betaproteobacteria bacterium]